MKNKAIKKIREFISQEKWNSYIVILPSQYLVNDFIDSLLDDERPGLLYPKFFTFESFVSEVLGEKNSIYISDMVKLALLNQVLDLLVEEGKLYYFQGIMSYGVINYVSEAIGELKQNLITADVFKQAVLPLQNARLNDLALIYETYDKQLQRKNFKDKEDRFSDVIEILKNDDSFLGDVEYAYIDWFFDNTPLQQELFTVILDQVAMSHVRSGIYGQNSIENIPTIKKSANHLANLIFTATETNARSPKIGIFNQNGREGEVRCILHELIRLLENGVEPNDIAIVARNPQDYGDILFKTFKEIGIKLDLKSTKPLMTNQLIKAIFYWLDLALYPHKPFSLADLLNNHYLCEPIFDQELIINWSLRKGRNDIAAWLNLWEIEGHNISAPSYADVEKLLNNIKAWQDLFVNKTSKPDIISAIRDSIEQWNLTERIRQFPRATDLETRLYIYNRDMAALHSFTDLLASLQLVWADDSRKTDLTQVVTKIKNYTDLSYYVDRPSHSGAIKVLSPTEIRGLEFHTVFVLGMEQNVFPRAVAQNPLLKDRERLALKSNFSLPLSHDLYEREKILFNLILQACRAELILTYSDTNAEGETNLPSLFLEDILHLTAGMELLTPYIPTLNPAGINPRLKHLLQVEARRNSSTFSVYEGCFATSDFKRALANKIQNQTYSISKLNLYAKCPLKYFFVAELGLDDEIIVQDGLSHLELGRLKHEVLARMVKDFANLRQDDLLVRTKKMIAEVCRENGWLGREYPHEWLWELEKNEIATSLTDLLRKELERGDFKPAYLEWRFGFAQPFILESKGQKIKLRGVVDRIDTDNAGHYAVYDYKERASMRRYEVENAKELQLPVYIMATEDLLGKVVGTAYIEIRTGSLKHFFYSDGYKPKLGFSTTIKSLTDEEWQSWLGTIKDEIIIYYNNMQKGIFPPLPFSCDYCHLHDICLYQPARIRVKKDFTGGDF